MSRRSAAVLIGMCLSAALAGCAGERPPAASSVTESSVSAASTWLAVLRVERDPDALDADTQALTDVLGGSLVVSPASCLRGLPPDIDASSYVLGVVAPDRTELDELVGRTDRDPVFRAEVEVVCTD
jgi:hypothetical protein